MLVIEDPAARLDSVSRGPACSRVEHRPLTPAPLPRGEGVDRRPACTSSALPGPLTRSGLPALDSRLQPAGMTEEHLRE